MNKLTEVIERAWIKARQALHQRAFSRAVRGLLKLPPMARGSSPITVLSMVQSRDVLPYLLALRSFARFINPQNVVVVCDPSISPADRELLVSQVPHIELRQAAEFRSASIPTGGCWERLSALTEYAAHQYVVQLDADTVTLSEPHEVRSAIAERRAFVLGEAPDQKLVTHDEARVHSASWQGPGVHIQGLAEFQMSNAPLAGPNYVRGCAGFTSFAPDAHLKTRMVEFSQAMAALTGARWAEWGTEQVASNYLVANQPGTRILPFPKYVTPNERIGSTCFIHFIGTQRFVTGYYTKCAKKVLNELSVQH